MFHRYLYAIYLIVDVCPPETEVMHSRVLRFLDVWNLLKNSDFLLPPTTTITVAFVKYYLHIGAWYIIVSGLWR
jgi:hypothetical protein